MLAQIKQMPQEIEAGSEWYILPLKWLEMWKLWCYLDIIQRPDSCGSKNETQRSHPGKIDYGDLYEPQMRNQSIDQLMQFKWQNLQIKKGAREGLDFSFVTQAVFAHFVAKYGSVIEEPLLNFRRKLYSPVSLDLRLKKFQFAVLPTRRQFEMKEPMFFYVSPRDLEDDLNRKILRLLNSYL